MSFHYGKHHRAYVDKLNTLLEGSIFGNEATLEEIVRGSTGPLFNNSAQAWNHTFFWQCMSKSTGDRRPSRALEQAILRAFGSAENFQVDFERNATENFGSGWTWLVKNGAGRLLLLNTSNAETPVTEAGLVPLLVADVWEHAYYIDYRNARKRYLDAFQKIMNWRFASERFDSEAVFNATKLMRVKHAA
jgi:Fe-Mn family superoxide dismutase